MADRAMLLRDLRRAVYRFGGWEDPARGKGSHTMFFRKLATGTFSYPIPTHNKEVRAQYVKSLRARLGLTADDGISDEDFYSS
jgi:hypothetical protein